MPFAFAIAALVTGRVGEGWLVATRRWTVLAWGYLTFGIVLGAWWSYETLGWGGYWAWDPVENASFLPWLTGTAFIHSVMVQERRGMLRVWNLSLVVSTFALTILGTFVSYVTDLPSHGVAVVGELPAGVPQLALPVITPSRMTELLPSVAMLVLGVLTAQLEGLQEQQPRGLGLALVLLPAPLTLPLLLLLRRTQGTLYLLTARGAAVLTLQCACLGRRDAPRRTRYAQMLAQPVLRRRTASALCAGRLPCADLLFASSPAGGPVGFLCLPAEAAASPRRWPRPQIATSARAQAHCDEPAAAAVSVAKALAILQRSHGADAPLCRSTAAMLSDLQLEAKLAPGGGRPGA